MVVRPDDATDLAKGVRAVFVAAETQILRRVARSLADGVDAPDWQARKLAAVQAVLRDVDRILARVEADTPGAVEEALGLAYNVGGAAAGAELAAAGLTVAGTTTGSVTALVADTLTRVQPVVFQIRRAVQDIYQTAVVETVGQVLTGTLTRREASAQALTRLTQAGVTGFRDKAGRRWDMASYAEMTARTGAMNASLQGASDRLTSNRIDTVIVSNAPEECILCRPFEGKVLSLSGAGVGSTLSDGARVHGSLAAARVAGLYHPNCRHGHTIYLPGITKPITDTADPEGNRLRVKQRAYERRIRELKRADIIAQEFGGEQAKTARRKLRVAQANFRAWRIEHDRKDLSYRTNLNAR